MLFSFLIFAQPILAFPDQIALQTADDYRFVVFEIMFFNFFGFSHDAVFTSTARQWHKITSMRAAWVWCEPIFYTRP